MKPRDKRLPILLLTALALILGTLLVVDRGEALETLHGQEWLLTPLANQKTQEGFCGANSTLVCRELCYFGEPAGDFLCFNN